jgi:hypothetical protein
MQFVKQRNPADQCSFAPAIRILPLKKAWYEDLAEYFPLDVRRQIKESSSSVSCVSLTASESSRNNERILIQNSQV